MKFVSLLALLLLIALSLCDTACHLQLGQEYPEPDEDASIKKITSLVLLTLNETYVQKHLSVKRDAHPKAHGCVKAWFTIADEVPSDFRYGVFADASAKYKAWIRFSNGNPKVQHDLIPDSRGMAVKIMGVKGKKVMPDEPNALTQDFVGANRPAFFLSTNSDYLKFFENVRRGGLDLLKWLIGDHKFREMNAARKFVLTEIGNVLTAQYFSATPYRLGPEHQAVKFSFKPVDCVTRKALSDRFPGISTDFLKDRLADSLIEKDHCFDFLVQKQIDACEQPIEDSVTEWTTPFVKLASLTVFKQALNDTAAGKHFCENLSFTPWHTLDIHRPLGNINRARKVVYQATSTFRHKMNGQVREEPVSW